MAHHKFSNEQLAAIKELSEALQKCQQLNIHISSLTEFDVKIFEDVDGNDYAAIS